MFKTHWVFAVNIKKQLDINAALMNLVIVVRTVWMNAKVSLNNCYLFCLVSEKFFPNCYSLRVL